MRRTRRGALGLGSGATSGHRARAAYDEGTTFGRGAESLENAAFFCDAIEESVGTRRSFGSCRQAERLCWPARWHRFATARQVAYSWRVFFSARAQGRRARTEAVELSAARAPHAGVSRRSTRAIRCRPSWTTGSRSPRIERHPRVPRRALPGSALPGDARLRATTRRLIAEVDQSPPRLWRCVPRRALLQVGSLGRSMPKRSRPALDAVCSRMEALRGGASRATFCAASSPLRGLRSSTRRSRWRPADVQRPRSSNS